MDARWLSQYKRTQFPVGSQALGRDQSNQIQQKAKPVGTTPLVCHQTQSPEMWRAALWCILKDSEVPLRLCGLVNIPQLSWWVVENSHQIAAVVYRRRVIVRRGELSNELWFKI